MAGKYTPLEKHLRGLPESRREVTLAFKQIEGILKSTLPSSAYEDGRWWAAEKEGNHVNPRAWVNAGWKVDQVNVKAEWVTFCRAARTRKTSKPAGNKS